ncbi:MAG TPA: ribonuclease T2 [Xanthobacteraceae bacterium]|jgi:ribonuclease T2|nr:ribonuclease T2 [Xanthobacteraceae bacterium]
MTATLGCLLALLDVPAGTLLAQEHANVPGDFDYYVLSLSWSPSFCATAHGAVGEPQCGRRPYSFVVHGLWPQYEKGFPENCEVPAPRLDHRIVDGMLDLMPAPQLVYHEWDTHGTCSGLAARDYFELIRKAREKVAIPPEYDNPQTPLKVAPQDVIASFINANPGLTRAGITIDCDRTRLREVRICLARDLSFRDCSGQRPACRSPSVLMPPAREP